MHSVHAEARAVLASGDPSGAEALLRAHLERDPEDGQGWCELAGVICRQGDLAAALPLLERSLLLDPDQIQAMTRLGAVLQHLGRLEDARAVLERAVAAHPAHGQAWCNLGIVQLSLAESGGLPAAREALERALTLDPEDTTALRALVLTLRRLDHPQQALPLLLQLVRQQPGQWKELMLLGHELELRGLPEEAETAYRQALAGASAEPAPSPAAADAGSGVAAVSPVPSPLAVLQAKLGVLLLDREQLEDGCLHLQQALDLAPAFPDALGNLALGLRKLGRYPASLQACDRALALDASRAGFHAIRGLTLRELGRYQEAFEALACARRLDPGDPGHQSDYGLCLQELGRLEEALIAYERALAMGADQAQVLTNRGMCRLQLSDQRQGWDDYESRFLLPDSTGLVTLSSPRWRGEDLEGDLLLLIGEQGFGDMLQMLRCAPWLRQRVGGLALCLPANLIPLAEASDLADVVWTPRQAEAHRGAWLPLFSLFHVLSLNPQEVKAPAPWLRVPDAQIAHWRQRIDAASGPVVALHWQGNPETERGGMVGRSLPLELLGALPACTPMRFVSLQKGVGAEQRLHCSFHASFVEAQDLIDTAWDYLDTAAILHCCDLLITSDSALAHLAGGLGLPVWLLLKQVPDWRWGLDGETTHWYPSMRLFRQRRHGDWSEVIERVCQALPAQLASRPTAARPGGSGNGV